MPRTDDAAGAGDPTLEGQLCFALYSAQRAMTARYRPHLDALGLTYPQFLVLLALWDKGEMPVNELGTLLRLDSGTLSPLLRRLADAGLVSRTRSARDERVVLIAATPEAEQVRPRATSVPVLISESLAHLDSDRLRVELHELEAALRA